MPRKSRKSRDTRRVSGGGLLDWLFGKKEEQSANVAVEVVQPVSANVQPISANVQASVNGQPTTGGRRKTNRKHRKSPKTRMVRKSRMSRKSRR